jgi:hypothetical protein
MDYMKQDAEQKKKERSQVRHDPEAALDKHK